MTQSFDDRFVTILVEILGDTIKNVKQDLCTDTSYRTRQHLIKFYFDLIIIMSVVYEININV